MSSLSCSLCFLLTLYAGLFVMFTLSDFSHDACACTLTLKSSKSAFQRFVFAYSNFRHFLFPPSHNPYCLAASGVISFIIAVITATNYCIILQINRKVNNYLPQKQIAFFLIRCYNITTEFNDQKGSEILCNCLSITVLQAMYSRTLP